jgi:hypothetical protein
MLSCAAGSPLRTSTLASKLAQLESQLRQTPSRRRRGARTAAAAAATAAAAVGSGGTAEASEPAEKGRPQPQLVPPGRPQQKHTEALLRASVRRWAQRKPPPSIHPHPFFFNAWSPPTPHRCSSLVSTSSPAVDPPPPPLLVRCVRVRVKIMGSQKYENVGESQPLVIMHEPIISTRTVSGAGGVLVRVCLSC